MSEQHSSCARAGKKSGTVEYRGSSAVRATKPILVTDNLRQRFDEYVVKNNQGCWAWSGAIVDGYGVLWELGASRQQLRAHRVSWAIYRGEVPEGMCVLHRCDNRQCTRPDHLFIGTVGDNNRDTIAKGRHVSSRGEKNGASKLTADDVEKMKTLRAQGLGYAVIARRFGVVTMTCWRAVNQKSWSHIQ
jgi:hypothetical protein